MKKLILILTFLVFTVSAKAQSVEPSDYAPLFAVDGNTHYIDKSSVKFLNNGRIVFWAFSVIPHDILAFTSLEADCKTRRVRIREIMFYSGHQVNRIKRVKPWISRNDEIGNRYVYFACK